MWASVSGHLFLDAWSSLTDLSVSSYPLCLQHQFLRKAVWLSHVPGKKGRMTAWTLRGEDLSGKYRWVSKGKHKPAALRQGPPNKTAPSSWLAALSGESPWACGLFTASQKEGLEEGPRPLSWVPIYFSHLFVWLGRGGGGVRWGGGVPRRAEIYRLCLVCAALGKLSFMLGTGLPVRLP